MPVFDVPGSGDTAAVAALIGGTSDTLGEQASTISGRQILFVRNLLHHSDALISTLGSDRPNPSSFRPTHEAENLRAVEHGKTWETEGCFVFSSILDQGYEMAGTAGNYNFRIVQTATVNIDIRDATVSSQVVLTDAGDTVTIRDPYLVAGALQALIRASALANAANFTVTYSGWRETSPTYKFTVACPTAFVLTVTADSATGWKSLGYTSTTGSVTSATGNTRAIHTEEYVVLALASPRLSFDRTRAYITGWRHLILNTNFNPADQTDPLPFATYNLNIYSPFFPANADNIDLTGMQFATKAALAAWLETEINFYVGFGIPPYTVTVNGGGGLSLGGGVSGVGIGVTGHPNSAGALIGFPADDASPPDPIVGANFDLDALNAALASQRVGGDKLVVYLATTANALEAAPDSDFTERTDMFTFKDDDYLGDAWGTDAAGWPRVGTPAASGHDVFPAGLLWADLYDWGGSALTYRYLRIKIVNRQNPAGRLVLGLAFVGPGMVNVYNVNADAADAPLDRTTLERSPAGALSSTYRRAGATLAMSTGVVSKDEVLLTKGALLDARAIDETQAHALAPNRDLIAAKTRPVWIIDPANRSDLLDDVGKAHGMIQGRIVEHSLTPSGRLSQGYAALDLVIEGER